jgi:hypothetical protein
LIARRSTWVEPQGTQISTRGLGRIRRDSCTLWMKYWSIFSVTVKSAITPSFSGRMAVMLPGRAAEHLLGLLADRGDRLGPPGPLRSWRIATTDGSFRTMPWSRA